MDLVPAQDAELGAGQFDELTLVCHRDVHVRVVFEDWQGVQQKRTVGRGTWPIRLRRLLGYRTVDHATGGWSADLKDPEGRVRHRVLGGQALLEGVVAADAALPAALNR